MNGEADMVFAVTVLDDESVCIFFFPVLELLLFLLIRITEKMISVSLFTAFVIQN